jgi:hypothetical protein
VKKADALSAILDEWRRLPEAERQIQGQLVAFAMKMAFDPDYHFSCRDDRYQAVMGFLSHRTSVLNKE